MSGKLFAALLLIMVTSVSGCTQAQEKAVPQNGGIAGPDTAQPENIGASQASTDDSDYNGVPLEQRAPVSPNLPLPRSSGASRYEAFTKAAYDSAKAEGKTILLEFYANWCPICAEQRPELESGFSILNNPKVAGFQVNYRDSQADTYETMLARQFGVTYQHTHVVIDGSEKVLLKSNGAWTRDDVVEKLGTLAG